MKSGSLSTKLAAHFVEKPWGRTQLPPMFGDTGGRRIGEVWFKSSDDLPLLAKYIFTSEPLSIQNHPSDDQARSRGLACGKNECWYVLGAEPGATLGLGLKYQVSKEELREAALNGSIVELIDWRPAQPGDFYYVPAGTVHAIGAGISLLEFQQNADVTYRIYDFGRPRELHVDEGISVATTDPYLDAHCCWVDPTQSAILASEPPFCLVQAVGDVSCAAAMTERRRWVLPIDEPVCADEIYAVPGECLLVNGSSEIKIGGGRALIGAEGLLIPGRLREPIQPSYQIGSYASSEQFASSE